MAIRARTKTCAALGGRSETRGAHSPTVAIPEGKLDCGGRVCADRRSGVPQGEGRGEEILDFRFWILDWSGKIKDVRSSGPVTLPAIENPKSKIQNAEGSSSRALLQAGFTQPARLRAAGGLLHHRFSSGPALGVES